MITNTLFRTLTFQGQKPESFTISPPPSPWSAQEDPSIPHLSFGRKKNLMVNPEYRTYVLVDVANVSRGAQNVDGQRDDNVRVSNRELVKILDDERPIVRRVAVSSFPKESSTYWEAYKRRMYSIVIKDSEDMVDDELHDQILSIAGAEYSPRRRLVLATGDGNQHRGELSFPNVLREQLLETGWQVELVTWLRSCNPIYETLVNDYPTNFRIRYLDEFRDRVTFYNSSGSNSPNSFPSMFYNLRILPPHPRGSYASTGTQPATPLSTGSGSSIFHEDEHDMGGGGGGGDSMVRPLFSASPVSAGLPAFGSFLNDSGGGGTPTSVTQPFGVECPSHLNGSSSPTGNNLGGYVLDSSPGRLVFDDLFPPPSGKVKGGMGLGSSGVPSPLSRSNLEVPPAFPPTSELCFACNHGAMCRRQGCRYNHPTQLCRHGHMGGKGCNYVAVKRAEKVTPSRGFYAFALEN